MLNKQKPCLNLCMQCEHIESQREIIIASLNLDEIKDHSGLGSTVSAVEIGDGLQDSFVDQLKGLIADLTVGSVDGKKLLCSEPKDRGWVHKRERHGRGYMHMYATSNK